MAERMPEGELPWRTIRLTVAYDGTDFHGWMYLPGIRTVQGVLQEAVGKVIPGETVRLVGSSRTDAGVHAVGQVAAFWTRSQIPAEVFPRAINAYLPEDVRVIQAQEASPTFHPIQDAVRKRYRYLLHDGAYPEIFYRRYVWRLGKSSSRLDVEAMRLAAEYLVGTHDFASFENVGSPRKDTVRTIYSLEVRRGEGLSTEGLPRMGGDDDLISIDVEGNGFLYNMVRNIAGTLMEVGRRKFSPDGMKEVLESKRRAAAGMTAPPQGLFLLWIQMRGEEASSS
ncbi:MAG: tRNA pseudouridine(38-40) synthase TruA [Planctomycetia bacterium]|nr:tRNA pseudouridine(38-40) synthase TruA [Planctomycetia bacterium]